MADAFFRYHTEKEIRERKLTSSLGVTKMGDFDELFPIFNNNFLRCETLHDHTPTELCKSLGCGALWAADGCWKITRAHCSFVQDVSLTKIWNSKINFLSYVEQNPQCTTSKLSKCMSWRSNSRTGTTILCKTPERRHYSWNSNRSVRHDGCCSTWPTRYLNN